MPLLLPRLAACAASLSVILMLTASAQAQESIGFEDPDDITNLLAYRLPDWGLRTIDLAGELSSSGSSQRPYHRDRVSYRYLVDGALRWEKEGERQIRRLRVDGDVEGVSVHDDDRRTGFLYQGQVDGSLDHYFGGDGWHLSSRLLLAHGYVDQGNGILMDSRFGCDHAWSYGHIAELGLGWGRVRNVTPLVRAQRLAERLVALGRQRPDDQRILAAAQIIAVEGGYGAIYERPDRRFWQDVLTALCGDRPLTVAEVFYLAEVLAEDVGHRQQGFVVTVSGSWVQSGTGDNGVADYQGRLDGTWARNLSLAHQISLDGSVVLTDDQQSKGWLAVLGGRHLWIVADRAVLDSELLVSSSDHDLSLRRTERRTEAVLRSGCRLRLEDRLTLTPSVQVSRASSESGLPDWRQDRSTWAWSFGLTLTYRLEGMVF